MREDLIKIFNCYKDDYFYLPKTDYVRILDSMYWYISRVGYHDINNGCYLNKSGAFDNLLPTTGSVNYMETKQCDSIIQCVAVCVFCAGLLYNQNTGTCHLLKSRLYETSFDRNRTDIGWGLFINNNGIYL